MRKIKKFKQIQIFQTNGKYSSLEERNNLVVVERNFLCYDQQVTQKEINNIL